MTWYQNHLDTRVNKSLADIVDRRNAGDWFTGLLCDFLGGFPLLHFRLYTSALYAKILYHLIDDLRIELKNYYLCINHCAIALFHKILFLPTGLCLDLCYIRLSIYLCDSTWKHGFHVRVSPLSNQNLSQPISMFAKTMRETCIILHTSLLSSFDACRTRMCETTRK